MLDLDLFINSLKCSWIKRLLDNNNHGQWQLFYTDKINNYGGKLLFESSLNKDVILTMFPKSDFLQEVLLSWVNVINTDVSKNEYVAKQIIWNNKNIQTNKKSIIYKNWFTKGIKYIEHIYDFHKKSFISSPNLLNYIKYRQLIT